MGGDGVKVHAAPAAPPAPGGIVAGTISGCLATDTVIYSVAGWLLAHPRFIEFVD